MRLSFIIALPLLFISCASAPAPTGSGSDIVEIRSIDPTIVLDIRYATANNFTGKILYPEAKAKLRRVAAESLAAVQRELRTMGLGLKVFDGYRPLSIQWKLWEIVPNTNFVADPRKGSKHNRGAAVDLTIVDSLGNELEMPTGYDDFSEKASHEYLELTENAMTNRALLLEVMTKHGFLPIKTEWWHYDFRGWEQFDIKDEPL